MYQENGRTEEGESSGRCNSLPRHVVTEHKKFLSGTLVPDNALSPKRAIVDGDR